MMIQGPQAGLSSRRAGRCGRSCCASQQPLRGTPTCARGRRPPRQWTRAGVVQATAVPPMDFNNVKNPRDRRPENVPGAFYVDRTCINCDTCRWMDPATFGRVGAQSAVLAQPRDAAGRVEALKALLSCPTHSIHTTDRSPEELRLARQGLPAPVPGLPPPGPGNQGIYFTGWAAVESLAGCAYLLVRPQGGNILVDSPRFSPVLARRIEAMGGVRYMFLTHRDDVGGHEAWAKHFGAVRILHELEVDERQGTDKVEIKLRGPGPWVIRRDGTVAPVAAGGAAPSPVPRRPPSDPEAAAAAAKRAEEAAIAVVGAIMAMRGRAAADAAAEAAAEVEEDAVRAVTEAAAEVLAESGDGSVDDLAAVVAAAEAAAEAVADAVAEAVTEAGAAVVADAVLGAAVEAAEAVEAVEAAEAAEADVTFVFTPGHTEGHVCMYYAPLKAMFTGDHLSSASGAVEGAPQGELFVYKDFNWYDFPEQLRSVAKMLEYDWLHVLPAHGRRAHFRDAADRLAAVSSLLQQHSAAASTSSTSPPVVESDTAAVAA